MILQTLFVTLRWHRLVVASALLLGGTPFAGAHEFWLAPERYSVEPGGDVAVSLRVGQMLKGTDLPYLAQSFREFTVTTPGGTRAVTGLEGDMPAVSYAAEKSGLHVLTYHSTPNVVRYETWQQFVDYLAYEGLDEIAVAHRARALPEQGFEETYTRYAKTLIQVGSVKPSDFDEARGGPLELVAIDNPYRMGLDELRVHLLRHGTPVANHQIAIIRYDGAVTRRVVETDADGRAAIPVAGGGTFLLSATDLQPVDKGEAVWESQWASLTFGLPIALPDHPLDPLARIEIVRAVRIIGQSGHADRDTRVALVTLDEPDKEKVLGWQPGKPFARHATAVVRNGPDVFEATLDLDAGEMIAWQQMPGVQPAIASTEWAMAQRLTKADPRWLAAMHARGYDDVSEIFCESLSAGFFDAEEERQRRLVKMPCYDVAGAQTNIYGRPIEGLIAVVDLNAREVTRVIDSGPVPVSKQAHEFGKGSGSAPAKATMTERRPNRGFAIDGRIVTWNAWSFHLGFDQRFGPVLSLVEHADGSRQRMILYQGHISEVFVPYMDADEAWYFRTPMDAGEYGLGMLASPLAPGIDCPADAVFIDADVARPTGDIYTRARVLCVFERDTAAPLWRHWEALNGAYAGRPATELVVRSIPVIGNYDYIVDWVFTQKGEIQINIGATGIDAVKGVAVEHMSDPGAEEATRTGMLVAPNLVAVHHDHYFSIRLDIDVDGPINNFVRERLTSVQLPEGPRRSLWRLDQVPMVTEGALSASGGRELWRIESSAADHKLGHRPSYQVTGGGTTVSMLSESDWPQRRGAFSGETLWITARRPGELFAGGPFPNQSDGRHGITAYLDGQPVIAQDVVAWYTIGFHHLTRPEDWPVLATIWHGVKLRPYGFFAANPGLNNKRNRSRPKQPN